MFALSLLVIFSAVQTVTAISGIDNDIAWLLWDFLNLCTILGLSILYYKSLANAPKTHRFLSLSLCVSSGVCLISFLLLTFFVKGIGWNVFAAALSLFPFFLFLASRHKEIFCAKKTRKLTIRVGHGR